MADTSNVQSTQTGVGQQIFKGLKTPRNLLEYNLMRGVTDFSQLEQFDLYEKGYPWLVVISVPDFMRELAENSDEMKTIVGNYVHILEHDFKGIDNIENITGEPNGEISNGIRSIQLINRVTQGASTTFTMRFYERSGSVMTKFNELYLTGIKDKDTQAKTYHGLIDWYTFGTGPATESGKDPGPHREVFSFMYFLTDNTVTKIEKAFLICAAQPTTAEFSTLYDGEKGEIGWGELSMSFNGFFINNDQVSLAAQRMLLAMRNPRNTTGSRLIVDSTNFTYEALKRVNENLGLNANTSSTGNDNSNPYAVGATSWTDANGVVTEAFTQRDTNSVGKIGSVFDETKGSNYGLGRSDGIYSQQVKAVGTSEHILKADLTYKPTQGQGQ
jgi:hypothetical protein